MEIKRTKPLSTEIEVNIQTDTQIGFLAGENIESKINNH